MTIFLIILLFVMLIFPHELGHFLAAKLCGVQVNEFAFGMGPVIFKKQGKETLYSIRALPIGGFCAMEGEDTEESTKNPRAFNNKIWWKKIIILVAGALMNVLLAFLVMIFASTYAGSPQTTIGKVVPAGMAEKAGVSAGDKIIELSGEKIDSWSEFSEKLQKSLQKEKSIRLTVDRDGKELSFEITPEATKDGKLRIGVEAQRSHNIFLGIKNGTISTLKMMKLLFDSIISLFSSTDGLNQITGPVGMVKVVSDAAGMGIFFYLYLVALISLNLAIFNLLPLPALDGGRIIFVVIRLFTGRAISNKTEARVHAIGMALLLALTVFVTWNDIMRLIRR
ncbi:MAG: RIP metalloprotease RseP [Eubacterium sp.]|nr:RIP metalloprotease RseP [Eubacterium sp.]